MALYAGIFHSQRGPVLTCLAVLVAAQYVRYQACSPVL
jgi:hypothetical protein